jgi:S1-C subfamily serine protease
VTVVDLLVVLWLGVSAASGFFRGFIAQVTSFVGIVAGLVVGAWIAPHLLSGGNDNEWVPVASLMGAAAGAVVAGLLSARAAGAAYTVLARRPYLLKADRIGGAVAGGLVGLALAWGAALLLLQQPALGLRRTVQASTILPALLSAVPPEPVLRAIDRVDPLPVLPMLAPRSLPAPDPSVVRSAAARGAKDSVVRIEGTSCGLGVQGSGWVVGRELVATNVHVVSGETDTRVLAGRAAPLRAAIVHLDARNDVALLRVPGLRADPLAIATSDHFPRPVVLLGYPGGGPLVATAATVGSPRTVIAPDAYDRGLKPRRVVPVRGAVRKGESGGPVLDPDGGVVAMIFGGARDGRGGFAIPVDVIVRAVEGPLEPVDAGPCAG